MAFGRPVDARKKLFNIINKLIVKMTYSKITMKKKKKKKKIRIPKNTRVDIQLSNTSGLYIINPELYYKINTIILLK